MRPWTIYIPRSSKRLLTEPLYTSWSEPNRLFLAGANVGLFYALRQPPVVPDVFFSKDIEAPTDWWAKSQRSYFIWEFGKLPEIVIEIVSNLEGDETGKKRTTYANIGIPYYVIWDPQTLLGPSRLQSFALREKTYEVMAEQSFPSHRPSFGHLAWQLRRR